MHKSHGSIHSELTIILKRVWLKTCESTDTPIARYFGEHNLLNSMLGTIYPILGSTLSGSASSALIPHITVVFPIFTNADPSAFEIESLLMIVERNSK